MPDRNEDQTYDNFQAWMRWKYPSVCLYYWQERVAEAFFLCQYYGVRLQISEGVGEGKTFIDGLLSEYQMDTAGIGISIEFLPTTITGDFTVGE